MRMQITFEIILVTQQLTKYGAETTLGLCNKTRKEKERNSPVTRAIVLGTSHYMTYCHTDTHRHRHTQAHAGTHRHTAPHT